MAGMTLFWAVFLTHLTTTLGGVSVTWGPSRTRRSAGSRRRARRLSRPPAPSPAVEPDRRRARRRVAVEA